MTPSLDGGQPLAAHSRSPLHGDEIVWQETNCYVDLWVELLHGWGFDARAALAFTVLHDFEDDQFTFFKFPVDDLDRLFGIVTQELALFDDVTGHVETQTRRGNVVLIEADSFYLPDTRATSYRREHKKTTIGIDRIDRAAGRLGYYHNADYAELDGEDYAGIFRQGPAFAAQPDLLPPYAEFAKRMGTPVPREQLAAQSLVLLRKHLRRRPRRNPVAAFRAVYLAELPTLIERGDAFFHPFSFNTLRQLGANFEMLAHYLRWLRDEGIDVPASAIDAGAAIASEAKVLQFRLARAIARRRPDPCENCFDLLERAYEEAVPALAAQFGEEAI